MRKGAKEYKEKHWGVGHIYEVEWPDRDLDAHLEKIHRTDTPELVEWGRLVGFHFIPVGKKKEEESWKCLIAVNRFMISVVNLCLHMLSRTKHEENYRQKEAHEGTRTKTYCLMRVRWILTR